MSLPPFIAGIDYRDLSPREYGGRWRFETQRAIRLPLRMWHAVEVSFYDAAGVWWGGIEGRRLWIAAGYAWNGCSPKRRIGRLWLGTPDFESTRLASLAHDFLYQFSAARGFPLFREDADLVFYQIMTASGFRLASLYYEAVREFAAPFWASGEHKVFVKTHQHHHPDDR